MTKTTTAPSTLSDHAEELVAKAGDPVIGPISTEVDAQPPLAYDKDVLKPGAGTKMQRWKAAYNKALAENCRQSDNPTECAREYANKTVGRVETDVKPVEKVMEPNGRVIKRIVDRGGAGSGHFQHEGRPGEKGGSKPGKGGGGKKQKGTGFSQPRKIYHGDKGEKPPWAGGAPESMPKAIELKGKERKKWLKEISESNTLEQLREKQSRANSRIGKMVAEQASDKELKEEYAYVDLLTEVVMYQQFPESRDEAHLLHEGPPMTIMESFDPLRADLIKRGGAGSGHHGHRGREGEVGGSEPGEGGGRRTVDSKGAPLPKPQSAQEQLMDKVIALQDRLEKELLSDAEVERLQDELLALNDELLDTGDLEYQREDPLGEGMKETHQKEMEAEVFQTGDYVVSDYEKKLDGRRGHKFLTKEIEKKLPALYSQENNPNPTVWAKWFHPYATQEWYATEYEPKTGMFFGWVNSGQDSELGYFSRQEMAELDVRGIPIERDLYFRPARLSDVKEGAQRQIPQDEYAFRLESTTLRGEVVMDEKPLKIAVSEEEYDGYVKRADVRRKLNDVDYALIERMGDQEIIRPDRFSSITWRTMPPS
ncbi:MAG: DUF2958 domain-containing protein, partial [Thermoplasmata archaeon]|nr:DUF2958 domain-containing protein [Thermoplasmata archaeon]